MLSPKERPSHSISIKFHKFWVGNFFAALWGGGRGRNLKRNYNLKSLSLEFYELFKAQEDNRQIDGRAHINFIIIIIMINIIIIIIIIIIVIIIIIIVFPFL